MQRNVFPSEIKSLENIQVIAKYGSCVKEDKFSSQTGSISRQRQHHESWWTNTEGRPVRGSEEPDHPAKVKPCHKHGRTHRSGKGITVSETCAIGYWIISGNTMVRQFVSKFVTRRYLLDTMGEKMADLSNHSSTYKASRSP